MDFLDPKLKKRNQIRLFLGYVLMAALIGLGTILLWYFSFGFNFDTKTNKVIQNGLVFIDSHPESATVFVNGEKKSATDARLVLPAGEYGLELRRDGYRTWKHSLSLEGGSLERFIYPFIFPEKLISKNINNFDQISNFSTQSPDRKWIVLHQPDKLNSLLIADTSQEDVKLNSVELPSGILQLNGKKHDFEFIEWSTDNRHFIMRHTFDTGNEVILIDRAEPSKSLNLNRVFSKNIETIRLKDKKYDKYYFLDNSNTAGLLQSAELSNKQITPILKGVLEFRPYEDKMIFYAKKSVEPNLTEIRIKDGSKDYKLRDLPKSPKYLLDIARFSGKWYLSTGSSTDKKAYIYIDPFDDLKAQTGRLPMPKVLLRLNKDLEFLSYSANARFIGVQSGSSFAVYDAENKRQFRYDTKLKLESGNQARWMDGHRMIIESEGKMRVFDFDGQNLQTLVNLSKQQYSAFFDRDYRRLFSLSQNPIDSKKPAFLMTEMRYEANK